MLCSRLLLVFLLLTFAGCSALAKREEPSRPTPAAPAFEQRQANAHLRVLAEAAASDSAGVAGAREEAVDYLAAQLGRARLQPALGREYRVSYTALPTLATGHYFGTIASRDLFFQPGVDYLPGARSDTGRAAITHLHRFAGDEASLESFLTAHPSRSGDVVAVVLTSDEASTARLRRLLAAGVRAAIIQTSPAPERQRRPIAGLLVTHMTPQATSRLLFRAGFSGQELSGGGVLREPVLLQVAPETADPGPIVSVMGYLTGRHPARKPSLVMVLADLTLMPQPSAGLSSNADVAALLEVARVASSFAHYLTIPERTVLFGVLGGQGRAGLEAYLYRPLWSLESTRSVIYIGLRPDEEEAFRSALSPYGIRLIAIPPPEPMSLARVSATGTQVLLQPAEAAAAAALRMASAALDSLVAETVEPEPLYPMPLKRPVPEPDLSSGAR